MSESTTTISGKVKTKNIFGVWEECPATMLDVRKKPFAADAKFLCSGVFFCVDFDSGRKLPQFYTRDVLGRRPKKKAPEAATS